MRTDLKRGELSHALAEQAPDLAVYQRVPIPGRVVANAFDWVAVLGTTADLLAIAGAIWAVYTKICSPKKNLQKRDHQDFSYRSRMPDTGSFR